MSNAEFVPDAGALQAIRRLASLFDTPEEFFHAVRSRLVEAMGIVFDGGLGGSRRRGGASREPTYLLNLLGDWPPSPVVDLRWHGGGRQSPPWQMQMLFSGAPGELEATRCLYGAAALHVLSDNVLFSVDSFAQMHGVAAGRAIMGRDPLDVRLRSHQVGWERYGDIAEAYRPLYLERLTKRITTLLPTTSTYEVGSTAMLLRYLALPSMDRNVSEVLGVAVGFETRMNWHVQHNVAAKAVEGRFGKELADFLLTPNERLDAETQQEHMDRMVARNIGVVVISKLLRSTPQREVTIDVALAMAWTRRNIPEASDTALAEMTEGIARLTTSHLSRVEHERLCAAFEIAAADEIGFIDDDLRMYAVRESSELSAMLPIVPVLSDEGFDIS